MGVSDALVGKTVRCSLCGQNVVVAAAPAGGKKAASKNTAAPSFAISPGLLTMVILLVVGVGATVAYRVGPARVAGQWENTVGPKAQGDVNDVVSFAIQSVMSETQLYDPTKGLNRPSVDGGVDFAMPYVVMTMPQKVKFSGMTQQGRFDGIYDTQSGEIEADIAVGGHTVGGLIVTANALADFHITGRDVNGSPQAELDGRSLKIVYPKPKAQ
jgi:hypothetical protein